MLPNKIYNRHTSVNKDDKDEYNNEYHKTSYTFFVLNLSRS